MKRNKDFTCGNCDWYLSKERGCCRYPPAPVNIDGLVYGMIPIDSLGKDKFCGEHTGYDDPIIVGDVFRDQHHKNLNGEGFAP